MKYPVYAYVNRGGNTVHEMICTTDSPIKQRALEDIANLLNCNIFNEAGIDQKTIDAIKKKA